MSELVMSGDYKRIQIYFPVGEAKLYRAIEALADKKGVSMSHVAREALRDWLGDDKIAWEVHEASAALSAMEEIRDMEPCRHRTFNPDRTVQCRALGTTGDVSRCVECEIYESR